MQLLKLVSINYIKCTISKVFSDIKHALHFYLIIVNSNFQSNFSTQKILLFIALIGSLTFGSTLCCSPIAGILVDKIGIRCTVFIGSAVATTSILISSFVTHQVKIIYFCTNLGKRIQLLKFISN